MRIKELWQGLLFTIEDSHCSLVLDLFHWNMRFDVGYDHTDSCVELVYLYVDLGCLSLKLAVAHWGGI